MQAVKHLAEASGWTIPESRIGDITAIYQAIADDTGLLRQFDLGDAALAPTFEAD